MARPAWRESAPWPKTWSCRGRQTHLPRDQPRNPLGLDRLSPFHQAKVDSANKPYALVFCLGNTNFSVLQEPPHCLQHRKPSQQLAPGGLVLVFHACCHGSLRRKSTAWLQLAKEIMNTLLGACVGGELHGV